MDRWLNKKKHSVHVMCPVCGCEFTVPPSRFKKYKSMPTCSNQCRNRVHSEYMRVKHPHGMDGKKHTSETIALMKATRSTEEYRAKVFTPERNKKVSESLKGSNHYKWMGGPKTPKAIKDQIRKSFEYRSWRKAVFERDNYACQNCGDRSGNGHEVCLEAHHIKSFSDYPELRYEVDNGVTLCKSCHKEESRIGMMRNQNGKVA